MAAVYREWRMQPKNKQGNWCAESYINGKAMKAARSAFREIAATSRRVLSCKSVISEQSVIEVPEADKKYLQCLFAKCFWKHLAMFSGHPRQGYISINIHDQSLLELHPSSSICHLNVPSPTFVVYDQVLTTSKKFMLHVNPVSVDDESSQLLVALPEVSRLVVVRGEVGPLGSAMMKQHFIGKGFSRLKELKEELRQKMNNPNVTNFLELEADVRGGILSFFCHKSCVKSITDELKNRVDRLRREVTSETMQVQMTSNAFALILEQGACVAEPLLMHDYTAICIKEPYNWEELKTFVVENIPSHKRLIFLNDGRCIIGFKTPTEALEAVKEHRKVLICRLQLEEKQVTAMRRREQFGRKPSLVAKAKFVRRSRKDFVFIDFDDASDASTFLRSYCLYNLKAKLSKNNAASLFIPRYTADERTFRYLYPPLHGRQYKFRLVREKPFPSTRGDVDMLEKDLERKLALTPNLCQIRTGKYSDTTPFWEFFLEFNSIEVGLSAIKGIHCFTTKDNTRSYVFDSMSYTVNAVIVTFDDVYAKCLPHKEEILSNCGVEASIKSSHGRTTVFLKCDDEVTLSK